jgi:hypothetical protein
MPEISYQVKTNDDEAYYRIVLPSLLTGEPEVVIRYYDDGRIFLDSGLVDIHYIGRRKHNLQNGLPSETVSIELRRERFANPRDGVKAYGRRNTAPPVLFDGPDRISSTDLDYI